MLRPIILGGGNKVKLAITYMIWVGRRDYLAGNMTHLAGMPSSLVLYPKGVIDIVLY